MVSHLLLIVIYFNRFWAMSAEYKFDNNTKQNSNRATSLKIFAFFVFCIHATKQNEFI